MSLFFPFAYDPTLLLSDPWVQFGLVFLLFYALFFIALTRAFKNQERGPVIVITLVLSIFAAWGVYNGGLVNGYGFGDISSYIIIGAFLLVVGLLFKALYEVSKWFAFLLLLGVWITMNVYSPYDILPLSVATPGVITAYEILSGWVGFLLLVAAAFVSLVGKKKGEGSGPKFVLASNN